MLIYSVTPLQQGRRTICATKWKLQMATFAHPSQTEPNSMADLCQLIHTFVDLFTKIRRTCKFMSTG
jgi:hypothetical protein